MGSCTLSIDARTRVLTAAPACRGIAIQQAAMGVLSYTVRKGAFGLWDAFACEFFCTAACKALRTVSG